MEKIKAFIEEYKGQLGAILNAIVNFVKGILSQEDDLAGLL